MDAVVLVGRILFALTFAGSAIGHLTNTDAMTAYARSKRLPQPRLAVLASGVYILVAALMIALGVWADLAALALVLFLLLTAFIFHAFWQFTDPQTRMQEQIQFFKDLSLAGGALIIFALYAETPPGLSLTQPLFSLG